MERFLRVGALRRRIVNSGCIEDPALTVFECRPSFERGDGNNCRCGLFGFVRTINKGVECVVRTAKMIPNNLGRCQRLCNRKILLNCRC